MRQLLKVELHLHLDCSLSYGVVSRLDPSVSRQEFEAEFMRRSDSRHCCISKRDYTRRP